MSVRRSGPRLIALGVASGLLVACGAPEDDVPAETEQLQEGGSDPTIDEEEAEELPANGAHGEVETEQEATDVAETVLDTATSDEYGEYLTDGDGRTLYVSADDPPNESTCTDACLQEWPILSTVDDPTYAEAVDEDLVGAHERDDVNDAVAQVTYREKPLYYHVQDELPGQITGQGADDRWFLIRPDGVEIRD